MTRSLTCSEWNRYGGPAGKIGPGAASGHLREQDVTLALCMQSCAEYRGPKDVIPAPCGRWGDGTDTQMPVSMCVPRHSTFPHCEGSKVAGHIAPYGMGSSQQRFIWVKKLTRHFLLCNFKKMQSAFVSVLKWGTVFLLFLV